MHRFVTSQIANLFLQLQGSVISTLRQELNRERGMVVNSVGGKARELASVYAVDVVIVDSLMPETRSTHRGCAVAAQVAYGRRCRSRRARHLDQQESLL